MFKNSAYRSFRDASYDVLRFLHSHLEFRLWMVTRVDSNDWIVLSAEDHGYDVNPGDVFRWTDSFCSRMVKGEGPCIAHQSDLVPAYKEAPIGQQVPIRSYAGVPLQRSNGELFGTLCAIDPDPMPEQIEKELPLLKTLSKLLTTTLDLELKAQGEFRRAERAVAESLTDGLTGIYNRKGWEQLAAMENERCMRYGHAAAVLSIDLDELKSVNDTQGHAKGDELIRGAAQALKKIARQSDVVARLGGDEFGLLAVECGNDNAKSLVQRLRTELDNSGVSASIGVAMLRESGSVANAIDQADQMMYQEKRARKPKANSRLPEIVFPASDSIGQIPSK